MNWYTQNFNSTKNPRNTQQTANINYINSPELFTSMNL